MNTLVTSSTCIEGEDYIKLDGLFLCLDCRETRKTLGTIKRHIFTIHKEPRGSDPNSENTEKEPQRKRARSRSPCDSIDGLLLSDEEDQHGEEINGLDEHEMIPRTIETEDFDSIEDGEDIKLNKDIQDDLELNQEIKIEIKNGTVEVIQIQEELDHEEEVDGRQINEEIIARYNKELQDYKEENAILKRKLTDKSEVERQIKEEVLATQKGLEKVFREMNQLKKNEQKAQEKLEETRDARNQWIVFFTYHLV